MARLVLILEDDYEKQYLESQEYLRHKFHNHPTRLRNMGTVEIPPLPNLGKQNPAPRHTPLGKLVI